MTKIKNKVKTEEENILSQLEDARRGYVPDPPKSRIFEIGDEVQVGNIKKSVVEQVFDGGKFYALRQTIVDNNYGRPIESVRLYLFDWLSCFSINSTKAVLKEENDIFIHFSQRSIEGLLHCHYSFGIDDSMEYQRELVWELEDKISLIDSIYKNIDIGKFCLIKLPYKDNSPAYEILDGKQRLNALKEFYESRFQYNGKYFHELSKADGYHFRNFPISWGQTNYLTEEQKYRYFIRLNTQGKPQDQSHMNKVMNLWRGTISRAK